MYKQTQNLKKIVPVYLILLFLLAGPICLKAADKSQQQEIFRQVGKELIQIAEEQYRRGLYKSADISLEKVLKYEQYLDTADSAKLQDLLGKVSDVSSQRQSAVQHLEIGRELARNNQLLRAKTHFSQALKSGYLTKAEAQAVAAETVILDKKISEQKMQMRLLYNKSVKLFEAGQLQEASVGFSEVAASGLLEAANGETAEDYLEKITASSTSEAVDVEPVEIIGPKDMGDLAAEPDLFEPVVELINVPPVQPTPEVAVEPAPVDQGNTKQTYIDIVKKKQKIQQSYTKAIVADAVDTANKLAGEEKFAEATEAIEAAISLVAKNKLLLDENDYKNYMSSLLKLAEDVDAQKQAAEEEKQTQSRIDAKEAQEELRTQQSIDRGQRIDDLMENSLAYETQQQYPEALGQLETLLAIDPTNRRAEIMRQTMNDLISLRRQLEIQQEIDFEETTLLTKGWEATIPYASNPYAEEITFPKNWKELTNNRRAEEMEGLSAADAAIYRQLAQIVDLSEFEPDLYFDEAIQLLKNSVEPQLKLSVRWKDLEDNAYIERNTAIGMQGISGISLGKALRELLDSVSGGLAELDYVVDEGIITVATKESLPERMVTRVYEVGHLLSAPAEYDISLDVGGGSGGSTSSSSGGGSSSSGSTSGGGSSSSRPSRPSSSSGGGSGSSSGLGQSTNDVAQNIEYAIRDIDQESWQEFGGSASFRRVVGKFVIIQTPQVHEKIKKLLDDLGASIGEQVAIEARFLFVTESFLEDIGVDFTLNIGAKGGLSAINFDQGSYDFSQPTATRVPGSIGSDDIVSNPALFFESSYNTGLDDLSAQFLVRATQAHRDSRALTAPKVTVLNGQQAYITVTKEKDYISGYTFEDITSAGENQPTKTIADPDKETVISGTALTVTPIISPDKRYVQLDIGSSFRQFELSDSAVFATDGSPFPIQLPLEEITEIRTRVMVPDRGTLLIGGQKLSGEVNKEAGVPGMSKIPFIGRLFSNRSKVKDQDIMLILVKPTIILPKEAEREYFAPIN